MPVFARVKINLIQLIHNLPDTRAVFHIVVGPLKNITDQHRALIPRRNVKILQTWEQYRIDKIFHLIAGNPFPVSRPAPPFQCFRNHRNILIMQKLKFRFFVINNFKGKHPPQLLETLRIPRNSSISPHNVLQ